MFKYLSCYFDYMAKKSSLKPIKKSILVFCAHSDDQIIGAGGSLSKYAEKGYNVYTYIMSYGEKSHPHMQKQVIANLRLKESEAANKVIGGKGVNCFGVQEGKFSEDFKKYNLKERIKEEITMHFPEKIFTHSIDDPLPDHNATFKLIKETTDEMKFKGDVYSFEIWNLFSARDRRKPKLVVDISETFEKKVKALKCFKSQQVAMWTLLPASYARAITNGLYYNVKYAETFYKVN